MQTDSIQKFQELKRLVLEQYQLRYPYVELDWQKFSSKDILQLIEDIQDKTRFRVSEKWIYTHLKPALNEKLPRKDMLDILCLYCDVESWNAFAIRKNLLTVSTKNRKVVLYSIVVFVILTIAFILIQLKMRSDREMSKEALVIKDFYTNELISDSTIKVYEKNADQKVDLIKKPKDGLSSNSELIVESPFYESPVLTIENDQQVIVVKPIDYALILKAYIKADLNDWNSRKVKLDKILSDDLEVLLYLPNQLGIEYLNKEEFSQKLIVPNSKIKRWEIVAIEQNDAQEITKVRIKQ